MSCWIPSIKRAVHDLVAVPTANGYYTYPLVGDVGEAHTDTETHRHKHTHTHAHKHTHAHARTQVPTKQIRRMRGTCTNQKYCTLLAVDLSMCRFIRGKTVFLLDAHVGKGLRNKTKERHGEGEKNKQKPLGYMYECIYTHICIQISAHLKIHMYTQTYVCMHTRT